MSSEIELRNGQKVDSFILNVVQTSLVDLSFGESTEEDDLAGAFAVGYLARLVKEGKPIDDPDSLQLLKDRCLIEEDGSITDSVYAIVDASFEKVIGLDAQMVNPLRRE